LINKENKVGMECVIEHLAHIAYVRKLIIHSHHKRSMTMRNLNEVTDLKLYQYQTCPYCAATRQVVNQTGLYIEERDVQRNDEYREELIVGGGKPQVPALRIETSDNKTAWLYESTDIIDFLHEYVSHLAVAA
jgi:glutaredoxin